MLILTRRPDEIVEMTLETDLPAGTRVEIMVMGVLGNQVRLGISAPRAITVDRGEIAEKKRQQNGLDGNVA